MACGVYELAVEFSKVWGMLVEMVTEDVLELAEVDDSQRMLMGEGGCYCSEER